MEFQLSSFYSVQLAAGYTNEDIDDILDGVTTASPFEMTIEGVTVRRVDDEYFIDDDNVDDNNVLTFMCHVFVTPGHTPNMNVISEAIPVMNAFKTAGENIFGYNGEGLISIEITHVLYVNDSEMYHFSDYVGIGEDIKEPEFD